MSKLKRTAQLGLGAGGTISTVCGLVADFFMPIAPYGIYLGFVGLLLLLISLGLFFIPATDRRLGNVMGDSWYLPSFVLLSVFTASMFGFYYMGKAVPGQSGYLAGNIDEMGRLQSQLLNINTQIEVNTGKTADNTERTASNTERLTQLVKRETSKDPRKELTNLGWSWSQESFFNAISTNNDVVVDLFVKGGMTLSVYGFHEEGLNKLISTKSAHRQLTKLFHGGNVDREIINLPGSSALISNDRQAYLVAQKRMKSIDKPIAELALTPLTVSIWSGNKELSSLLISYGASTEPYCAAVEYGTENCVYTIDPANEAQHYGMSLT
jgi:hypothetical protein